MIIDPASLSAASSSGFIVFEGVNGAGKSTLIRRVVDECTRSGRSFISTFEPGSTALGKRLRQLLLESSGEKPAPLAELLLFCADRAEHVERVIRPALAERKLVLCDRYLYSTIAFQGYGRGIDRQLVDTACAAAIQGTVPDLVILLDLDPAEGLRRTAKRGDGPAGADSFESEQLAFHQRIRAGFHEIAAARPEPFVVLDASRTADAVFESAWSAIERVAPAGSRA